MIGPLKNLHFFDFRHITSRFFEELRTMFFGTNFYFLSFVREGYQTALLSQRLIARRTLSADIAIRRKPARGKTPRQYAEIDPLV
jgi:hypothetical protein